MATGDIPQPPAPPTTHPRIRIRTQQLVGLILLAAIPVLAVLGVFGEKTGEARAETSELELRVRYPARLRYKTLHPLEVHVRNLSDRPLDRVTVRFADAYISQFSNVQFMPSVNKAFEVELRDVQPGEERLVSAELQAERYGRHSGTVTATTGPTSVTAPLQTFTFP